MGVARAAPHLRRDPHGLGVGLGPARRQLLGAAPDAVGGVPVQTVGLCGRAGDAWVMDMGVLHAPAVNAARQARVVLTWRFARVG